MKIYYNGKTESWFHNGQDALTFGGQKIKIAPINNHNDDSLVSFNCQVKDQHIGPLLGIMTSPKNESYLAGNHQLFTSIQNELMLRNALSFVFSFQEINENGWLFGYIYMQDKQEWLRARVPFPDIVYNRIPFRKSECTPQFQKCMQLLQHYQIPVFNPCFIDKYKLYKILKTSRFLHSLLPETILITTKETLREFLIEHKRIYIKPRMSSKGKNTYRLKYESNEVIMEAQRDKTTFLGMDDLWRQFAELEEGTFIAQLAIKPAIMNGNRFDFRVLSHWSEAQQNYIVTGVGIRATDQYQITTHLANGGFILPYKQLQTIEHDRFISELVSEIGFLLSNKLGFFGEFSVDAGIDSKGNYILFEVNSKPMSFDEEEIERNRVSNLCDLILHKTNFN